METHNVYAPWTPQQVKALNHFQRFGGMHPFTCGREHPKMVRPSLVATVNGWICVYDDYVQDWAPAYMFDPPIMQDILPDWKRL